jgi:predicted secreted protein
MKNSVLSYLTAFCLIALFSTACTTPTPTTTTPTMLTAQQPQPPRLDTKGTTTEDMKNANTTPTSPRLDTKGTTTEDMKNANKTPTPPSPRLDTKGTTTEDMKNANKKGTVTVDGCQERATIKKGETLQVLLPATPATGYVWTLVKPSTVLSQTQSANPQYKKDAAATGAVGTSQKQILEFTAVSTGTETIDVIYSRSFEKNKPAKKCTISVSVQ